MTLILAIDLGKFKSVACIFDAQTAEHRFVTLETTQQAVHDLIVEHSPTRVVIESGAQAGWISDLCETLEIPLEVANANHESWRWKKTRRKTDRDDALRLAKLSAMNQLPTVYVPRSDVRGQRSLIAYRSKLVGRRTAIKNNIRAILDRQGLRHPSGRTGWTIKAVAELRELAMPIEDTDADTRWCGQLDLELVDLEDTAQLVARVETKLNTLAKTNENVKRLRTIPGVGPRLAELVVASIDDPHRFKNGKQVGAYAGLVPRQYESGTMNRQGRITGGGDRRLRSMLVEVAWLMRRHNPHLRDVFDRVCRGTRARRKIAVVATARRLLIICWAMMRDETTWQEPTTRRVEAC